MMNEIENHLIITQTSFLIDEWLDITKIQNENRNIAPIEGKIINVNQDVVTLKLDSQIIKAENKSSYPLNEGDTIVLSPVKYQNNKIFYKIMDIIKEDSLQDHGMKIPFADKLDILPKYFNLFQSLSNAKSFNDKIPIPIVLNRENISDELFDFAKSSIMFTGKMIETNQGFLLQVDDKYFNIDKKVIDEVFNQKLFSKVGFLKFFEGDIVCFINKDNEKLLIFPKNDLLIDNLERFIKTLFSDAQLQPKDEMDMYIIFNLLMDKKAINREEFIQTRIKWNQFLKKLNVIFDLHYGLKNKNDTGLRTSFISKEDIYLLFKILEGKDELIQNNINHVLSQFDTSSKTHIQFDFGYYLLDMFKINWDINGQNYDLKIFVNNKKGSKFKSSSIMIKLSTDNLGHIGIYVKKLYSKSFKIIFISNRLSTIEIIKNQHNILINSLSDRGYTLNIEYKLDNLESSNIILDYLKYEIDIQKIDLRL